MMGRDNLFDRGRSFKVYYDNTQGLSVGTKLMYNGFKIGMVRSLKMDENQKIIAIVEVSSDMKIPEDSKIKIEAQLLGGVTLKLLKGNSKDFAEDGDVLDPDYSKDVFGMINTKVVNVTNSADSLFNTLNAFLHKQELNEAVNNVPVVLHELTATIIEIRKTIAALEPALKQTSNSLGAFSSNLPEYDRQLREGLEHFNQAGRKMDSVRIADLLNNLSTSSEKLALLLNDLNQGKGSMGKLLKDEALYSDIRNSNAEIQRIMLDLKKYPEKYIPVPGTKNQRKKAKKKSLADTAVWH
ncbi:MAG: MCE family protein [Bacteroidetes bacterium]|nr:MCE family protein [Bacteroidota bacterium]